MTKYLVLMRGINVGGKHLIKMADLKDWLVQAGFQAPRTYLQSGNLILQGTRSAAKVEQAVSEILTNKLDFEVPLVIVNANALSEAIAKSPYIAEAEANPKAVHLCFLAEQPVRDHVSDLQAYCTAEERLELIGKVLYIYYPNLSGKSKLTLNRIENVLQTRGTARNWNTARKLEQLMAKETHDLTK